MTERIYVSDGTRVSQYSGAEASTLAERRARKLREVRAYMYNGWEYVGWGSAPPESVHHGGTGFWFERTDDSSGSGFGAEIQLDRLASGLHFGISVPDAS